MERSLPSDFKPTTLAPGSRGFDLLAIAVICAAYTTTLFVAREANLATALIGGVANTVPIVLFGGAARRLIIERIIGRTPLTQLLGHAVLCVAFSLLSFWVLLILLGMANAASPVAFEVQPFAKGNAWQLLENATTYALIAALSYLQTWRLRASAGPVTATLPATPASAAPRLQWPHESPHHFIRSGEDILPVDMDRVVSITGADDYAEVVTLDRNHLVRMTLAEFERTLDPAKFVRIHRSAIVNVKRVQRAEPAGGGRMLLHMENGQIIQASRTGSRLLRARII